MKSVRKASLIGAIATILLFPFPVAQAADPNKVVRFAFRAAETGFDPPLETTRYSAFILEAVFDSLLTYDYLARPVKLVPNVAEAMPDVADNGATYTFHIKRGVYFAPDAAFSGQKRELTAEDFAYSIRRFFDPRVHAPNLYYFEGKIVGADEAMEAAKKIGKYDYDMPIAGLQVIDRYTLRIRLKQPDYNFLYFMALPSVVAMAREAVEYYGDDIRSHPVGTGPYYLKEWRRASKIVLEANPNYRDDYFAGTPDPNVAEDQEIAAHLKGRKLPIAGRVEVSVIEEPQPRWLSFLNKEFDYLEDLPNEFINTVAPAGNLAPNLVKQGLRLQREAQLEVTVTAFFNMDDPVVGGYTPEKVALRRAMNLAYNGPEEVQVVRKAQALRATSPIPPGVAGYDQNFRSTATDYDPARAKALLDMYGYLDRDGDGYRELPDGSPLTLEFASLPQSDYRDLDEVWRKSLDAVGIRIKFRRERFPELVKAGKAGTLQVGAFFAWFADFPDGENFLQLLYGPNVGKSNYANFRQPDFDRLYDLARTLPDSPERTKIYQDMTRLMLVYAPWKLGVHRIQSHLSHPWLLNYRKHPILHQTWKYLDVDLDVKRKALQ